MVVGGRVVVMVLVVGDGVGGGCWWVGAWAVVVGGVWVVVA
jgi:hypothetical protein